MRIIRDLLMEVRPATEIQDHTTFHELDLDSLDAVDLLIGVEETAGVVISDVVAAKCRTVGDLASVIARSRVQRV
jgi:acyl carrier protein